MTPEISIEYIDVIKAYQMKCNDFLNQIISLESRLNATNTFIESINSKNLELQEEIDVLKKSQNKTKRPSKNNEPIIE